jgi:hypothetical protein
LLSSVTIEPVQRHPLGIPDRRISMRHAAVRLPMQ